MEAAAKEGQPQEQELWLARSLLLHHAGGTAPLRARVLRQRRASGARQARCSPRASLHAKLGRSRNRPSASRRSPRAVAFKGIGGWYGWPSVASQQPTGSYLVGIGHAPGINAAVTVCRAPRERGSRSRRRASKRITMRQASTIMRAIGFAREIGRPLIAHATIHWAGTKAGDDPAGRRFAKVREGLDK